MFFFGEIMEYDEFLKAKQIRVESVGFTAEQVNPMLKPFQADIVRWACRKGRAAVFAGTGLGKSPMQLDWASHVAEHTHGNVLILAPLGVALQTVREGDKFGIPAKYCRSQGEVEPGITVANYEMLEHFRASEFAGVVLDESSILKSYSGVVKKQIVDTFAETQYKLACTATPSPNDYMEILNQAEFLGVMKSHEALAIWFINDSMSCGSYRVKGHAEEDFWRWVGTWAVSVSKPSDLGDDDGPFILPPLNVHEHIIPVDMTQATGDLLFRMPEMNATSFHKEKRLTTDDRAKRCAEIAAQCDGPVMIWCQTNYEADALKEVLPDACEVRGNDSIQRKEEVSVGFACGKLPLLISKASIFGFGLNFQACHNVIFCGLDFSYESYYQAVRRFWRFGQAHAVEVHLVLGETEKHILSILSDKEARHEVMLAQMQGRMNQTQEIRSSNRYHMEYTKRVHTTDLATAVLGDSVEEIKTIDPDSVGYSIFSPPFSNLYIYSDSFRDMGNCKNDEEFLTAFRFLIPEILRITRPGRLCSVHCKQLPKYRTRDGRSGLRDFRGEIIRAFEDCGWQYHSEVCIWKDPVIEMQRTKCHGLLYKQLRKDATYSRQGMADYLVSFRKWGETDDAPVTHTKAEFPLEQWQQWASPVWADIRQTNVLNVAAARDERDEKHICPLQLDLIERAIRLWSNPDDVVFSPFMGIGSEGYVAIKARRRFLGIELKESYFNSAVKNLTRAEWEASDAGMLWESQLASVSVEDDDEEQDDDDVACD